MSATATPTTSPIAALSTAVKDLADKVAKVDARLTESEKANESLRKGVPFVRKGEDVMSSRGYMFSRLAGLATKKLDRDQCKLELAMSEKLEKEYGERGLFAKTEKDSVLVPLSSELMQEAGAEGLCKDVRELLFAGVAGADPGEMRHLRRKTMSWLDAGNLAELVPYPVMGEPIEFLRNQEVFMALGAKTVPFPAGGRMTWPRFTGSTTGYWLGTGTSNREITESELTTGDLVLQAKKLGAVVQLSNELLRFPSVSVEAVVRADILKTLALKMDRAFLDGEGSMFEPKGIIKYDNIIAYTAGDEGVNGNRLLPEDVLQIIAAVEENNIDFTGWVGRAKMYAGLSNARADAVVAGDKRGAFLFNMLREMEPQKSSAEQPAKGSLEGYPFHKSNQIVKTRAKGGSSDLTYLLGGNFGMYMIALSGVMEFAVATQGTIFRNDQSEIRCITWCDGAPRYEEAFVWVDELYQTN